MQKVIIEKKYSLVPFTPVRILFQVAFFSVPLHFLLIAYRFNVKNRSIDPLQGAHYTNNTILFKLPI